MNLRLSDFWRAHVKNTRHVLISGFLFDTNSTTELNGPRRSYYNALLSSARTLIVSSRAEARPPWWSRDEFIRVTLKSGGLEEFREAADQ